MFIQIEKKAELHEKKNSSILINVANYKKKFRGHIYYL